MQSEAVNPSPTTQNSLAQISNFQPEVKTGFANPLEFLQAAAAPAPGQVSQAPQPLSPEKISEAIAKEIVSTPTPPIEEPPPVIKPTFFEEVEKEETPVESAPPDEVDEFSVETPAAENFKKLRTTYRETKKTLKELEAQKSSLEEKVRAYETGEAFPDTIKQKDEEIVRLSKYEKLVNLKQSKEYQERFVKPLTEVTSKLKEIFAEYGVPAEHLDSVVGKALNTENRIELNRFLQDHLGNDELGAIETKELVKKAKEIQGQALAAEKEPASMLEQLQNEAKAVSQARDAERRQSIVKTAETSWVEALTDVRSEGKLVELIHKDNDPEFNKFYPDRLLPQAAKEYGKLVTELARLGAEKLPPELAKGLAKMVLLSHASGVAVETRNRALDGISELTQNLTRHHTMLRPPIGGGVARGANGGPPPATNVTPKDAAQSIINQVINKR